MNGRTRDEVLLRIRQYRRDAEYWGDRYQQYGEDSALSRYDEYQARINELTWVLEGLPLGEEKPKRSVIILNGPYAGQKAHFRNDVDPVRIQVRDQTYKLITDPDTGESLGAYALETS